VIYGVSRDTVEAQKKFATKLGLTFRLLADAKGGVIKLYGVDGLLGFAQRKTFLVNSKGKIGGIFQKRPMCRRNHLPTVSGPRWIAAVLVTYDRGVIKEKRAGAIPPGPLIRLVAGAGFEPATFGL
jgi:alkyl hydroperoxide reductase subunit AhpC